MDLDKICRAFKRNRFDCTIFETAEEAAAYLSQEIHGKTVGMGDSMTLENMKMYERLSENNEVYDVQHIENKDYTSKERMEQFLSMARKCLMTDVFLTSANAASETGELVNIEARKRGALSAATVTKSPIERLATAQILNVWRTRLIALAP